MAVTTAAGSPAYYAAVCLQPAAVPWHVEEGGGAARQAEGEGALAYIAGGIVGAPIGLGLLQTLPPRTFAGGLGLFLIACSVVVLLKPHRLRIKVSGWKPAVAAGAAGGILGGFSAFPGSMPVVYLGLRGVSKADPVASPNPIF
jgi:hypothetical protein